MAPTCPAAEGTAKATIAAPTAILARSRSGHRLRPMPHTACTTTATATIFNPCNQAACDTSPTSDTP